MFAVSVVVEAKSGAPSGAVENITLPARVRSKNAPVEKTTVYSVTSSGLPPFSQDTVIDVMSTIVNVETSEAGIIASVEVEPSEVYDVGRPLWLIAFT